MTSSGSKAAAGAAAAEAEAEADADAAVDDAFSGDNLEVKNESIILFIIIYKYFNISICYRNQCKLQRLSLVHPLI